MLKLRLLFRIIAQDLSLEKIEYYSIYLLNLSDQTLRGQYSITCKSGVLYTPQELQVDKDGSVFLGNFKHDLCGEKPEFKFSFADKQINYKLRPQTLFSKIKDCQYRSVADFSINLNHQTNTSLPTLKIGQNFKAKLTRMSKKFSLIKDTLDLHLGQDVSQEDVIHNGNIILEAQMAVFQQRLQLALEYNLPTLNIIHGKGEGILKTRILKFLRTEYPYLSVENWPDGGRTIIYLQN